MTRLNLSRQYRSVARPQFRALGAALQIRQQRTYVSSTPALSRRVFELSDSWDLYRISKTRSFLGSMLAHALVIGVIAALSFLPKPLQPTEKPVESVKLIAPSLEAYPLRLAVRASGGGGGGGAREKIPARHAELPRVAPRQVAAPRIVVRNETPKLAVKPTVVAPPQIRMSSAMPNLGNPAAPVLPTVTASAGTGSGGGIGSGSGGGVGSGSGPGVGDGHGGGIGGGVYRVGGVVLAPVPLATPDPEYTEAAREAKLQGMCVLRLIVGSDGKPRDLRVIRSLGMGLDEKAIAAVQRWVFSPATKDGKPVPVMISVQVSFKLD